MEGSYWPVVAAEGFADELCAGPGRWSSDHLESDASSVQLLPDIRLKKGADCIEDRSPVTGPTFVIAFFHVCGTMPLHAVSE